MEYCEYFFENEQISITCMYTINIQIIWLANYTIRNTIPYSIYPWSEEISYLQHMAKHVEVQKVKVGKIGVMMYPNFDPKFHDVP